MTTPGNTNTTNTEIILLQVTVLTTTTKEQPTARRHYLERLVMGQLAKTHVTHPNYPNFHGIRQYRVLIIPFSAKLNVIPYRYIIQYDTRSPSQHPHSWMEFEDFLPSRHFTIAPGDIKSTSKTPSIHGFSTY